jgi:hypothetical protein
VHSNQFDTFDPFQHTVPARGTQSWFFGHTPRYFCAVGRVWSILHTLPFYWGAPFGTRRLPKFYRRTFFLPFLPRRGLTMTLAYCVSAGDSHAGSHPSSVCKCVERGRVSCHTVL